MLTFREAVGSRYLLEDCAEMNDYDASTYGDGVADVYDGWYSGGDVAPIVGRLAELAGDGPVLELGIGTGRVALPLAERVLAVHGIDASMHHPVHQKVKARVVSLTERGTRFYPLEARYCWPSELDLMARLAGLELEHRWGGWNEEPFTAASGTHVTVYEKPS
jgi:hypothetical protein